MKAKIFRDDYGVPHIYGDTMADAVYGLCWAHCEDNFENIQEWLLAGRGMLGHYNDWDGPYFDYLFALLNIRNTVEKEYNNQYSDDYKVLLQAYCKSLNAYSETNTEEIINNTLFPVNEIDVVCGQQLMGLLGTQLDRPFNYLSKSLAKRFQKKEGSNVVAISSKLTSTQGNIIAINPHQPLEGLFSFYEAHIQTKDIEIYGFILPCTFSFLMGTNRFISWGLTSNYPDLYDLFKLKIISKFPLKYKLDGKQTRLKSKIYSNKMHYYGLVNIPIIKRIFKTDFGNVFKFKDGYYHLKLPSESIINGGELTFKLSICKSTNEAKKLCTSSRFPYSNLVVSDIDQNILFIHNALEPVKEQQTDHYNTVTPLDKRSQIWENKFYPANNLVITENPECGFIVSCNQSPFRVTSSNISPEEARLKYKGLLYFNENSRSKRLKELISIKAGEHSLDTLREIICDYKIEKQIIRNIDFSGLYKLNENIPKKVEYILDALKKWDGSGNISSEGAAYFALLFEYLKRHSYIPKNTDINYTPSNEEFINGLLWVREQTKNITEVNLGKIQKHIRGNKRLSIGGLPDSVNTVRPTFDKSYLRSEEGSAFRLLIDLKNNKIYSCHPYGSSKCKNSKHYDDQMEMFVNNLFKEIHEFQYYVNRFTGKEVYSA